MLCDTDGIPKGDKKKKRRGFRPRAPAFRLGSVGAVTAEMKRLISERGINEPARTSEGLGRRTRVCSKSSCLWKQWFCLVCVCVRTYGRRGRKSSSLGVLMHRFTFFLGLCVSNRQTDRQSGYVDFMYLKKLYLRSPEVPPAPSPLTQVRRRRGGAV